MPGSKHRAGSRPASAKPRRPASAGRARPSSAVPLKGPEPALEVCAVCKDQPLVFHECPDCSARYCASGCLHSWYEHSKCARAAPIKVPVVSSEEDYIKATLPDKAEVEFGLSRAAGGVVIADQQEEKKRWSISSVDGWVLGQPGPGQEWRPARGVELTLEELGRCRSCKAPLHMQEYICNRAARVPAGAGPAARSGVQRPRVKTFEASTQTDVEFAEAGVQATTTTAHQEVQASPPAEFAHVQSQAAIAGHMLASLALPAEAPGGAPAEMRLTAEPMVAAAKVRGALAAVAQGASTESNAGNWAAQRRHADFALRSLGAQEMLDDQADSSRALGHRMRTVAPPDGQEAEAPGSPSKVQLQDWASSTFASAALAALRKAEPPTPGQTAFGERDPESSAEAVFWAAGREEASVGQAQLHVALANVAAMLCAPVPSLQVMPAMTALAQLLPSAAEGGMPSWRSLAKSDSWPSAGRPGGEVKPSGWPELKESLTTLFHLAAGAPGNEPPYQDAEGVDHSPASLLFRAVEAIARLALKLDAQATAREDAQAAQQAALAAPPPPPPPPPPGGEMSSAVDAFLSQGAPANPSAASAVDAYLQQGTAAPVENPFAPGGARPGFGAGAFGPGGGSTSLTLGPVGGCGGGFGCGAAGGSTSLTLGPVGGGCGGGFGCGGCGGGLGGCGGCGGGLGGGFGNLGGCGCGSGLGGGCEGSGPIGGGGGGQVDPARAMQDLFKTKRR